MGILLALIFFGAIVFAASFVAAFVDQNEAMDQYAKKHGLPNAGGVEYDWQREFRRRWSGRKNSWDSIDPEYYLGTGKMPKVSKKWLKEWEQAKKTQAVKNKAYALAHPELSGPPKQAS